MNRRRCDEVIGAVGIAGADVAQRKRTSVEAAWARCVDGLEEFGMECRRPTMNWLPSPANTAMMTSMAIACDSNATNAPVSNAHHFWG